MNAVERTLLYFLPFALLIVEAVTLVIGGPQAPHHFLNPINKNPDFTVAAVAVTFMAIRRADIFRVLAIGLLFEGVRLAFLTSHHISLADSLSSTGLGFWCAALLLAGLGVLRSDGGARWKAMDTLAIMFALPATIPLLGFFLWLTVILLPQVYDNYLYAFDGLLPVPAARILAESFERYPWFADFCWYAYHSLIGVFGLYVVLQRGPDGQLSGHLISRWLLAGCLGFLFFFYLPGLGPLVAFGNAYPMNLPDPNGIELARFGTLSVGLRNAMPSLHIAWALLILLAARNMPLLARAGALMFLIATLISTLALGEHYLIDLVVAVPLTVAVDGLATFSSRESTNRWSVTAAIGGMAMTVAWMLTLRYGMDSLRGAPWIASWLVLGTIAASGWLLRRQPVTGPGLVIAAGSRKDPLGITL